MLAGELFDFCKWQHCLILPSDPDRSCRTEISFSS
jgi:hypothetical protein